MFTNLYTKIQLSRPSTLLIFGTFAALLSLVAALFGSLQANAAPPYTVTGIAPSSSTRAGGDAVTVTGAGFDANSVVKFNATAAVTTYINDTTLSAITPTMNAGAKNITVSGVDSQSNTLLSAYTLTEMALTVTSVAPSHGPSSGGRVVTLTGQNLGLTSKDITNVSVGVTHSCGVYNGQAYCWGSNVGGQLGDGTRNDSTKPVAVNTSGVLAGKNVTEVSVGTNHACAIADGRAYCWGAGASGRLGNNTVVDSFTPVAVDVSGVLAGKTVTAISAGSLHTCAVASGLAYCWGFANNSGQLGNNLTTSSVVPVAVSVAGVLAGKTVTAISAGSDNTCVVASGLAYCWGNGTEGRLGNASTAISRVPVAIDVTGVLAGKTVSSVSVNSFHACTIADGRAYCWGNGANGKLGNAASTNSLVPVAVNTAGVLSGKTVRSISAGSSHSCVVASDNQAYCWGYNNQGQLGNNTTTFSTIPVAVNAAGALAGKTIDSVTAGSQHTCAVASDNKSYCWGFNTQGQLGNGSTTQTSVAVASTLVYLAPPAILFNGVPGQKANVASDTSMTIATPSMTPGSVAIGITSYDGQTATLNNSYTADAGPSITSATPNEGLISGGNTATITGANFTAGAQVFVGGVSMQNVVVVNANTITATVPAGVAGYRNVEVVASDGQHSLAEGAYKYNNLAPSIQAVTPVSGPVAGGQQVTISGQNFTPGIRELSQITTGARHACGIYNQQAYCWGANARGQLGDNTRNDSLVPVAVDMKTAGLDGLTIKAIGAGTDYTCAIASNNAAYCWGTNLNGELGANLAFNTTRFIPTAVSTAGVLAGKSLAKLSAGYSHACAIDTAGAAYCWGEGYDGQLGNNSIYNTGSVAPVAVLASGALLGKTVLGISAGYNSTCALASDNRAYCWGDNANGKLGNNTTLTVATPVAVDTLGLLYGKTITKVVSSVTHTCATTDDNNAYCWGGGSFGQLGDGQAVSARTTAVQVNTTNLPAGVGIKDITVGSNFTCAVGTDNQAYCWGQNNYGQLGNGSTGTQVNAPIPSTNKGSLADLNVVSIEATDYYVCAVASDAQSHCWGYNNFGRFGNNTTTNSSTPTATQRLIVQQPNVLFGSSPATNVQVLSDTSLSLTTPAGTVGSKDVTVTQYDTQNASQPGAYTYMAKPELISVAPQQGSVTGGDTAVLTGSNFTNQTKIKFDNSYIAGVSFNSATSLSFTVPARPNSGGVDVTVEDEFGAQSTIKDGFRYVEQPLAITSISPNAGPSQGGQVVTVNGQNFSPGIRELSQISTADTHSCGVYSGKAYCWGLNTNGQLGNNSKNSSSIPVEVTTTGVLSGKTISSIETGAAFSCATTTDAQVYCWGLGLNGMLGNGATSESTVPVAVSTQGVLNGKTILKLSVGTQHSCVIASDSRAYCWGYGSNDALGNGVNYSNGGANVPVAVATTGVLAGKDIRDISAGSVHTCAVDTTNKTYCWGANTNGQLGNGGTSDTNVPVAVDTYGSLSGKNIRLISAGGSHTCAVDSESKIYCWGYNFVGQLANGSTATAMLPTNAPFTGGAVASISAGTNHTCISTNEGKAYCAGYNIRGQIGDGTVTTRNLFTPILDTGALSGKGIHSVAAGQSSTCVVAYDEQGYCWGLGTSGQLGNGGVVDSLTAIGVRAVKISDPIVSFAGASGLQTQLLTNTSIQVTTPAHQAGLVDVSVARYDNTSATLADGYEFTEQPVISSITPSSGVTTGGDIVTISGQGFQQNSKVFVGIFEATNVTRINTSTLTFNVPAGTAGIRDITVRNSDGQNSTLADSFTYFEPNPTLTAITPSNGPAEGGQQVTITGQNFSIGKKEVSQLAAGANHTCGIYAAQAYCWGAGDQGKLGTGSSSSATTPTAVSTSGVLSGKSIKALSAGEANTCAIASDNQAYCWGRDASGALGNNISYGGADPISSIPTAVYAGGVLSGKTIKSISTGASHSCVIASDDQVYCWGSSSSGQLGNGSTSISGFDVPVAVNAQGELAGKTVIAISAGAYHTCAIASDSQAYCWGTSSRLGQGTSASSATPVAVSRTGVLSGKSLASISAGEDYTCAVSTDGAVYCWGANTNGQLGDGTVATALAPVLATAMNGVSGGTVTSISAGYRHTCAIGTNGAAYCWGLNESGELGDTTVTNNLVAQPVSTAGAFANKIIVEVASGKFNSCAIASDNQAYCWGANTGGQHGNASTTASRVPTTVQPLTIANMAVLFDTTPATNVQVQSPTTITATTPAHGRDVSDVSVQRYDGKSGLLADAYEFTIPPGAVTISQSSGPLAGGNTITITGQDFVDGLKVKVGDNYSSAVTVVDDTTATFVVPAGAQPVATDVTVEDAFGQTSTITAAYTYQLQNQTITSASPNKGTMAGGTVVTITGSGFTEKQSGGSWYEVWFGDKAAANVTYVNETTLRATTPATTAGAKDVQVRSAYTDTATLAGGYTFLANSYAFTNNPVSIAATEPGRLTITARNAAGNAISSTSSTLITLSSSSSTGKFARSLTDDEATRWNVTTVTLPAGQSSVDVWYKDATAGNPVVTGVVDGISNFTYSPTINSLYKFQVSGVSDPVKSGVPSSVTVRVVDYAGYPVMGYTGTFKFTSSDLAAQLPANASMNAADFGVKTLTNGVTMKTQGERCVTVTDIDQPSITGSQCAITVQAAPAGTITKLAIISSAQRISTSANSAPITVQTQATDGTAIPVAADTQVYLYSNASTGAFSVDQTQWTNDDPLAVTIPAGSSSVNVYFKDSSARTTTISARDLTTDTADSGTGDFGLTNARQTILTTAAQRTGVAMSGPLTLLKDTNGTYTLELRDSTNQALTATSDISITLTSSKATGRFATASEPDETNTKSIVIPTGEQRVTFQFKDTQASTGTQFSKITATDSRPEGEPNRLVGHDLNVQIVTAYPTKSTIEAAKTTLTTGEIIQVTTTLRAADDSVAYATASTPLGLTSTSPGGQYSLTESPFVPIASTTLAKGESTRTLFFRNTLAGTVTIRATASGLTTVTQALDVVSQGISSLRINTSVSNLPYDTASSVVSVNAYDLYGNVATAASDQTVYLFSSEGSTRFATTASGPWEATSVVIPAGQSLAQFYIKDTSFHSGNVVITAAAQSPIDTPDTTITRDEHTVTIVSQPVANIVITTPERTIAAGNISDEITIELRKSDGSASIQDGKSAISLQVNEGRFIANPNQSAPTLPNITVPAGASSATMYYTGETVGEYTFSLSKSGTPTAAQRVTVTPDSASAMRFASIPQTVKAGVASNAIRIDFVDEFNNEASFAFDQTFDVISSCSTGLFSESTTTWSDVTSFTVAAGATDATFYYKDVTTGDCTLSVTHQSLETITQPITITSSAPTKLLASVSISTPVKGQPVVLTVTTLDEDGNIRPVEAPTAVYIASSSPTATIQHSTMMFSVGESSKTTTYTDTVAGSSTISFRDQLDQTDALGTMTDATLPITYVPGPITELTLTPSFSSIRVGELQKLTIGLINEFGIATPTTVPKTVSVTTNSASASIKDELGNVITQVIIPTGLLSADIYVSQTQTGTTGVTAQSAALDSANANVTTLSESVNEMRYTNLPYTDARSLEVGEPGDFRVELYDIYGNITTTDDDITLQATSSVSSSAVSNAGAFVIRAGASNGTFSYTQNVTGNFVLSINSGSEGGLEPITQNGQVVAGVPTDFVFNTNSIALERGAISEPMSVELRNEHGALVQAGAGGRTISLGVTTGTGVFSTDTNGVFTDTLDIQVPEGQSSTRFYYRNDDAVIEVRRCNGATDETRSCSTESTQAHTFQGYIANEQDSKAHQVSVDMNYGEPVQLSFTTPVRTQEENRPSYVVTVERQNQYAKAVPLHENSRLYLNTNADGTGEFGSSKVKWGVNSVLILDSEASASFYYRDSAEGERIITASDSADPGDESVLVSAAQPVTILPASAPLPTAANLLVTNISDPQSQGNYSSVIVVARDNDGYIVDNYEGTITFTSNDPSASLPQSYTFDPAKDKGSKTFTNLVAFASPGEKTVTATDTNGITGSQTDITVTGGNTQPVASIAITQPQSPLQLPINTSSDNITVELRDANGEPTIAPLGGLELVLSSTLSSTQFKFLQTDNWSSALTVTVPAGLSFANFYIQGTETGLADVTVHVKTNPARISNKLTVVVSDVAVSATTTLRSLNAFGEYQNSAYLFANGSSGAIQAHLSTQLSAKDTFADLPVELDWQSSLRQGSVVLGSRTDTGVSSVMYELTIDTLASAENIFIEVDAAQAIRPADIKTYRQEVRVSPWATSTAIDKQSSGYTLTASLRSGGQPARPAFAEVMLLPSNATESSQAVATQRFSAPETSINYSIAEDGSLADGTYRALVVTYDSDNQVTSQELTGEFRLDSTVETPAVPPTVTPGETTPEQPEAGTGTPGDTTAETPEDTTGSVPDPETGEETPEGGDSDDGDGVPIVGGGTGSESGDSGSGNAMSNAALQTAIVSTYIATTSLAILFIREAYKEFARVVHLRSLLRRERKLAMNKNTFLSLSAHYLRTPITILDAASSMVSSPDNSLQKAVASLRAKANTLLSEGVEKNVADIQDPNIAKATRSALLSVFFWLPIVMSIVITIAVTMLLNGAAAGQQTNPVAVYTVIITAAVALIALFGGRTVYINNERQQMEKTLQLHHAQLFDAKSKFIAGIRTEINEEVGRVKQFATYATIPENVRTMLSESIQGLDSLINKLIIAEQINSHVGKPSAFVVGSLLDATIGRYQGALQARRLTLARHYDDQSQVTQDGQLLSYVTNSVLDNAIQYGKEGSIIDISTKKHRKAVEMTIANDTNLTEGIEGIFEPFNHATAPGDLTVGGAGLSLYLDKLIMNHLGGDITAKGGRGEGKASIRITFPSIS